MPADDSFRLFVLDQLAELGEVRSRAMFGGHGFYWNETFFAIVFGGRLYFKTNERTISQYVDRGMKPFRPNRRQKLKGYYEVPADVIEDRLELARWAREAARFGDRPRGRRDHEPRP